MQACSDNSSLHIFKKFLARSPEGEVISEGVLSKECYDLWVQKRRVRSTNPQESFRKILTAHIRGSEGRKPFTEEEEQSLLQELRKKRVWPCFHGCKSKIGINGFRAKGFHEEKSTRGPVGSEHPVVAAPESVTTTTDHHFSSYEVFVKFAKLVVDGESMILSKQCYETWVQSRRNGTKLPEFSFRKALMAHLSGKDGRRPFPEDVEKLILVELRKKRTWPCFSHRKDMHVLNIGKKGFKKKGFHEEKSGDHSTEQEADSDASTFEIPQLARKRELTPPPQPAAPPPVLLLPKVEAPMMESMFGGMIPVVDYANNKRRRIELPKLFVGDLSEEQNMRNFWYYDSMEDLSKVLNMDYSGNQMENKFFQQTFQDILADSGFCENVRNQTQVSEENVPAGQTEVPDDLTLDVPELTSPLKALDPVSGSSILFTFEDVSHQEAVSVLQLRDSCQQLFDAHLNYLNSKYTDIDLTQNFLLDGTLDVRLLRILRTCKMDVNAAILEIDAMLNWRKRWEADRLRHELISQNISIEILKKEFTIGKNGGCHPFYSQDERGDVTDIWVVKEQEEEDSGEMINDLYSHVKLYEFRSIVLDRLSCAKRKLICYKVILDCNVIKDEHAVQPTPASTTAKGYIDWWKVVKTWSWYINELSDCATRWYPYLSRVHVFGSGYWFRVIFSAVARQYFGSVMDKTYTTLGAATDNPEILEKELGDKNEWPDFYGGDCTHPLGTGPAMKSISSFGKSRPTTNK